MQLPNDPRALRDLFKKGDDIRDAGLTTPESIRRFDDLAYGSDPMQVLDIYCLKSSTGPNPTIVSIHGGGYVYGDKERYQYYCMELALRGFTVVNFSYPLAPEHHFPEHLFNTNAAIAYAAAHAAEYYVDPNNMFLVGDSAGAQMASQYAAIVSNPAYAAEFGMAVPAITLRATALNCGMYQDLGKPGDGARAWYMGENPAPNAYRLMDVCSFINADYPPAFIMSGKGDFLLPAAEPFYRFLKEKGLEAELHLYGMDDEKDLGHVFHCNVRTEAAKRCNDEECNFFRKYVK